MNKTKVRLSATIDANLLTEINKVIRKEKVTRSFLLEKALEQLLKQMQEKELEAAYKNMKEEDQEIANLTFHAQSEVLP
ncbi:MAG: hypothetical protein GY941_00455 [Planctomycetes bacterium]|nr:hypothetical protein [Planctomycetota bacterium]